jgi:tetratricopeptide (TPR) repeat protein/S1-C subfamily serine protease
MKPFFLFGWTVALLVIADIGQARPLVAQSVFDGIPPSKPSTELRDVLQNSTVKISLRQNNSVGSGVILDRQGELYTMVTNRHVVCGQNQGRCTQLPVGEEYTLLMPDPEIGGGTRVVIQQKYMVDSSAIKLVGKDLDLAIIQFRSKRNYAVAKVAAPGSLKTNDVVYASGISSEDGWYRFTSGKAIAVVNKRLTADRGGYSIIYDADTWPGMSGGGIFDSKGQLVAIHGVGDRYKPGTVLNNDVQIGSKIGYNRGIPVRWLVQNLSELGINIGGRRSTTETLAARPAEPSSADEHFIAGFNKFIDAGTDVVNSKRQAIQEFNTAIQINPRYARAYFTRAYLYGQLREFPQAARDYGQAIALEPKFLQAYRNRGLLRAYELNDFKGALADYSQLIALEPRNEQAYYNRGNLKADRLNDLQGALADYNQAVALMPKYSGVYLNRGKLRAYRLNDVSGALADFNQMIALEPNNWQGYDARANLRADKLNDLPGALADADKMVAMDPQNATVYNNRGVFKEAKLNDPQGALLDYNKAIAIDAKQASFYYNRGTLKFSKLKDFNGALNDYNKAISLDPRNASFYLQRASFKAYQLKDLTGALADFDRALTIEPYNTNAYTQRAKFKAYTLKDLNGGLADMNQIISLYPNNAMAYFNRAILKTEMADLKGALNDYNKAIALDVNYADAYINRGNLKSDRLNDFQGGMADYNQVINLLSDSANRRNSLTLAYAYNNRGEIKYQRLNDTRGGLDDLTRSIAANPNFSNVYYLRGDIFHTSGNKVAALKNFRKVVELGQNGGFAWIAQGIIDLEAGSTDKAMKSFNEAAKTSSQFYGLYKYRGLAYQQQGNKAAAIKDWQKAASLCKQNNLLKDYSIIRGWLKSLGAVE